MSFEPHSRVIILTTYHNFFFTFCFNVIWCEVCKQWNLSNSDTNGTEEIVFSGVGKKELLLGKKS